jgi:hypothetical protein
LPAAAQERDPYADEVVSFGNQIFMPTHILGAPDGSYADFFEASQAMVVDMGATEEGIDDLVLHYQLQQFGAEYLVDFMDADMVVLASKGRILDIGKTQETVAYDGTAPYRFLRITSLRDEVLRLDAVEATAMVEAQVPQEPAPPSEPGTPPSPSLRGILVKLVDDGNPETTVDAAVYEIGGDGKRHAFPSETVFMSWYQDFEDVSFIDPANLASYALGPNVTIRPGTHLIKITTDPRVYAVEPGGILRWIVSEQVALDLYGADWAKRVVDIPDVFFRNYTMGPALDASVHPNGTLAVRPDGQVVYLRNGVYYTFASGVFSLMRFQGNFVVILSPAQADLYVAGGELSLDPDIRYPY